MFNRCHNCHCCCSCNNTANENIYESSCDNVSNTLPAFDSPDELCNCGFEEDTFSVFPDNFVFGQSYVPIQRMDKTFTPCVGLRKGTLFPELVSPYSPCQSLEENAFIKATNTIGEGCNQC